MEFDSRKKSRRDSMMRSKTLRRRDERDRSEGIRRVKDLSHLVDENNRICLPDGRKGMRRPGKIENVKKKVNARARKMV